MKIIKPEKLKRGDCVGIVAPSDALLPFKKDAFKKGVRILENFGFKVVFGKNIFKRHGDYMAGTDKERADDLNKMFAEKKIRGIFCLAGGSSANRLLPLVDFNNIKNNPKVFVGFSDITTLLLAIYVKTGLVTFHGPNVTSPALLNKFSQKSLFQIISEAKPIGKIIKNGDWSALKNGKAVFGNLVGGNLEIMVNLSGTEYFSKFKDSILFWEEYNEPVEDIDMTLEHLKLTGALDGVRGMIAGKGNKMLGPSEYQHPLKLKQAILEIVESFKFPIIFNADFGHVLNFVTLPIGIKAKLNPRDASLEILESAVI